MKERRAGGWAESGLRSASNQAQKPPNDPWHSRMRIERAEAALRNGLRLRL